MIPLPSRLPPSPKLLIPRLPISSPPPLLQFPPFTAAKSNSIQFSESSTKFRIKSSSSSTPIIPSDKAPTQSARILKIAIIGFGNYGQFLAKTLISQGHIVLAYSRLCWIWLIILVEIRHIWIFFIGPNTNFSDPVRCSGKMEAAGER